MSARPDDVMAAAKKAAEAHTNLNIYAAVQALMEGSLIYGGRHSASLKIIAICKKEQQRELRLYDAALARIGGAK